MIALQVIQALWLLSGVATAAMVKNGTTCTVTPLSSSSKRSVEPVEHVEERDPIALTGPGLSEMYPRADPAEGERKPIFGRPVRNRDYAASDDDAVQILQAFQACGQGGTINITQGTYNIRSVMNTTGLKNVDVHIYGTLIWDTDIQYWLSNSISVIYSGRSTAWLFGGNTISMQGHGQGLFNGNGQTWYDENKNQGNQNGRPISLTIWQANNVWIDGLTWRQSQFWHTFVAYSQNVTMTNLDMNATSDSQWTTVNTDGFDSWNSKDIVLRNWTVTCGDDCISVKGNSSNVDVRNITCHESGAMCIGSLGSNPAQPEYVDNVWFQDVHLTHSSNAAWIKTYPGTGHVRNVTFKNIDMVNVNQPIYVIPCIYTGQNCDGSQLGISNISWINITGTSRYNVGGGMHCSAAVPCQNFHFEDINIQPMNGGNIEYLCSNIENESSMGLTCNGTCPASWPQQLTGNNN